jgi:protein phosphatase
MLARLRTPGAAAPGAAAVAVAPPSAAPQICSFCKAPRKGNEPFCDDCGFVFPAAGEAGASPGNAAPMLIKNRYHLGELLSERGGVSRFRATDGANNNQAVIVLRSAATSASPPDEPAAASSEDEDMLPTFDVPTAMPVNGEGTGAWPSIAWEKHLLTKAEHPAIPKVFDHFVDGDYEYLIEESPGGQSLWNAWDDPDVSASERFGYLKSVAEGLHALHKAGAILEGIRPDIINVPPLSTAMIADLTDLLPLPLPPSPPVRGTHYTAPELVLHRPNIDARADLYSFGAMLYALSMGRELTDMDFEKSGVPKNFIARNPDVHPLMGRLVHKTFCRDPQLRFPTDEAGKKDPTGFQELIDTLETCRRTFGNVRLEIAAWTTTGIVRTGNEDAFALMHAIESRQDDLSEYALVLLADGMGGYEAGEIAAALAIQTLRKYLVSQKMFAALAGENHPTGSEFDVAACKQVLVAALKEANKTVHQAPSKGIGRRGMGCTAEAVYVDGHHVVVGHVGDSRTYHLHQGRLIQLTRDQTLVNRLVELGQITAEEADNHPRKNELQQAVGGRADVEPAVYHGAMQPGDWVLVCSDGLTNHIKAEEIQEMLQSEAGSAEVAARRLVNFTNLRGATDNSTVVVIRAT